MYCLLAPATRPAQADEGPSLATSLCAKVIVEIARRNPPDQPTVVGSGSVVTSILPPPGHGGSHRGSHRDRPGRRDRRPGEQVAVAIAVENRCDDLRVPALLYDALGLASVVRLCDEATTRL